MKQQVTIRIPASTSNLGPGFDCLGVALRIYNSVTIKRADDQLAFAKGQSGSDRQEKIAAGAAEFFFNQAKQRLVPVYFNHHKKYLHSPGGWTEPRLTLM